MHVGGGAHGGDGVLGIGAHGVVEHMWGCCMGCCKLGDDVQGEWLMGRFYSCNAGMFSLVQTIYQFKGRVMVLFYSPE